MAEKKLTFEQAMERLEAVTAKLERGDTGLEEAMALFEEGTKLSRQCSAMLDKAEQKIIKLTKGPDGKPLETAFDPEVEGP